MKLYVDTDQQAVLPVRGGNATLPCRFWYDPELQGSPRRVRVKWSWLPAAGGREEEDVLVVIGPHSRSFGRFRLFVVRCPLSERKGLFCFRWLDVPLVLELEKCQICRNSMKGKVDSCL